MKIKAFIFDFDGTLVEKDILSLVCGIVGKEKESVKLNDEFIEGKRKGLSGLIERINFLHGVKLSQIEQKLEENDFLISGANELFAYLKENKIVTILRSGNIEPILKYYQNKLGIDYIVGARPKMKGDVIDSISQDDFTSPNYKLEEVRKILRKLKIQRANVSSIGDSPSDLETFEFASLNFAINPKNGIEKHADYVVSDLGEVLEIINKIKTS